ncbi:MAG: hypothetical protein KC487_14385, partial [Anaerolineae bacterium]|nr:hypothetical protein [Anaerolineae bacterium]
FHPDDGENALTILPQLDDMIASRCQEFSVPEQSCHFYIQWDFADGNGQPLPWRDMPLPPLAATSGDVMDAPIYLVNGRQADWQSAELRRRLQEYYPGRAFVAQSDVEMMRPANVRSLPASLLGDPYYPLILPSPSLEGVDDNGQPHPRWLAHVDRLLTDLVMRQSEGFTLGSAEYVNGTWALHQALLAIAAGFPAAGQLITADNEAPPSALPVEIPDLAGLGAALQSNPDDVALSQLAGLVRYLQAGWTVQELDRLPQRLGTAASLDLLLQEMLDTDVESFTAGWRQQELSQADSPLSGLVQTIVDLTQEEAVAWLDSRWQALKFYSGDGRAWLMRNPSDNAVLGSLSPNDHWQVDVTGIGATGPYVWAEMTLDDGEQLARDLRFYVFDEANGWLRHSPVRAFWGDSRSLSDDLVRWSYHEIDEAAVQAVAPLVEDAYAKVIEDIGLAPLPISVTVKADTEVSWDPDSWSSDIDAPSPRSYVLDIHGDNGTDALRRDVLVRLLVFWHRRAMELAISQVSENNATFIFPSIESAFIAEREAFDVQFATSPSDQELVVRRALEEGRLPEIGVLAAGAYSAAWDSIEGRSRMLLEIYVFERHGFQWLDTMQKNGLAYTLDLVMQEKGWTLDDLEADWREFLTERSRQ